MLAVQVQREQFILRIGHFWEWDSWEDFLGLRAKDSFSGSGRMIRQPLVFHNVVLYVAEEGTRLQLLGYSFAFALVKPFFGGDRTFAASAC